MLSDLSSSENELWPSHTIAQIPIDPEFQLSAIFHVLRKHIALIIGPALLGLILAIVFSLVSPKMYTSTATIEVNKRSDSPLGVNSLTGVHPPYVTNDEMTASILTEEAELQSATLAFSVIDQLGLASVPPYSTAVKSASTERDRHERLLRLFQSRLKVSLVKDTKLIKVAFTDTDSQRTAIVANAIVNAYIRSYAKERGVASAQSTAFLTSQLAELREQVLESEKHVSDYQAETGFVGSSSEALGGNGMPSVDSVIVDRFVQLNRELTTAEVSRIAKSAFERITDTQNADVVLSLGSSKATSDGEANSTIIPDPNDLGLLASLHQQRSAVSLQIASRASTFGSKSPQMIQAVTEIAEIDAQTRRELARIHQHALGAYRLAQAVESGLRRSVAAQQELVNRLNTASNKLLFLQQEANSKRRLYQELYAKLEEATVSAVVDGSNIMVVDPARSPVTTSSPKILGNASAGLIAGALLGIFLAFLFDLADDRLTLPREVERATGVRVLWSIPFAKAEVGTAVLCAHPRSSIAESFRGLRKSLLLHSGAKSKVILFTSPVSEDGKTVVSFNTATAFALSGAKVLLLETDLRRPRLEQLAGASAGFGLSGYLLDKCSLGDAIRPSPQVPGLDLLMAGASVQSPAELIDSEKFVAMLIHLSVTYDFIFISSAPLLLVSDALAIAPHADRTLIVVRSGKTSKSMLAETLAQLSGLDVCLVVNGLDPAIAESGYRNEKSEYYAQNAS